MAEWGDCTKQRSIAFLNIHLAAREKNKDLSQCGLTDGHDWITGKQEQKQANNDLPRQQT